MKNLLLVRIKHLVDYLRTPSGGAIIGALLAFIFFLAIWWQTNAWYQNQLLLERRANALEEINLRGNVLLATINRRVALLEGLASFVKTSLDVKDFDSRFESYASGLYYGTPGIRSISAAPQGTIGYIFPESSSDQIIGMDLLNDPDPGMRADVQRTIDTGEVTLSVPERMPQGNIRMIARQAVYQDDNFWGLVSIVIDLSPILDRAGLSLPDSEFTFALRDGRGNFVLGSRDTFDQAPVLNRIELPDGEWQLAAVPNGGWQTVAQHTGLVFPAAGLIIVFLFTGVSYLSINNQARLREAVQQRTQEISRINQQLQQDIAEREQMETALRQQEEQYRSIFESVRDGLFVTDLDGHLVDFNPAACRMYGYTPEEFRHLEPAQFIHPDWLHVFDEYLQTIKAGERFRGRSVNLHKNGTSFYVEVLGTAFTYRGQPHSLGVVRDVTEEVQARQLLEQRVEARTRELSSLLEVSHNVAATLELKPLLAMILEQLQKVVGCANAAVLSLEREHELIFLDQLGAVAGSSGRRIELKPESYFGRILEQAKPLIIPDVYASTPEAQAWRKSAASQPQENAPVIRSWLGVPLLVKERTIGMLVMEHERPNFYTPRRADLALAIANQAAIAIENARLYEQAQQLAALQERQKLARELHDSVSQALYGIGLGTRTAQALLEKDPQKVAEPLEYVLSLAEASLAEMRALIFELRPESLESEGLVAALNQHSAALRARYQIDVENAFQDEPPVPIETKQAIYRVAQEALHNVVKHAQAGKIRLSLAVDGQDVILEVEDNGQGFDPQGSFPGHFGLRNMLERVEHLGGALEIESNPGQGTCVRARIPLQI